MSLFHRKRPPRDPDLDLKTQQPALRKSICTGEITIGYIDRATGKFHELLLARDAAEAEEYFRRHGAQGVQVKEIY